MRICQPSPAALPPALSAPCWPGGAPGSAGSGCWRARAPQPAAVGTTEGRGRLGSPALAEPRIQDQAPGEPSSGARKFPGVPA